MAADPKLLEHDLRHLGLALESRDPFVEVLPERALDRPFLPPREPLEHELGPRAAHHANLDRASSTPRVEACGHPRIDPASAGQILADRLRGADEVRAADRRPDPESRLARETTGLVFVHPRDHRRNELDALFGASRRRSRWTGLPASGPAVAIGELRGRDERPSGFLLAREAPTSRRLPFDQVGVFLHRSHVDRVEDPHAVGDLLAHRDAGRGIFSALEEGVDPHLIEAERFLELPRDPSREHPREIVRRETSGDPRRAASRRRRRGGRDLSRQEEVDDVRLREGRVAREFVREPVEPPNDAETDVVVGNAGFRSELQERRVRLVAVELEAPAEDAIVDVTEPEGPTLEEHDPSPERRSAEFPSHPERDARLEPPHVVSEPDVVGALDFDVERDARREVLETAALDLAASRSPHPGEIEVLAVQAADEAQPPAQHAPLARPGKAERAVVESPESFRKLHGDFRHADGGVEPHEPLSLDVEFAATLELAPAEERPKRVYPRAPPVERQGRFDPVERLAETDPAEPPLRDSGLALEARRGERTAEIHIDVELPRSPQFPSEHRDERKIGATSEPPADVVGAEIPTELDVESRARRDEARRFECQLPVAERNDHGPCRFQATRRDEDRERIEGGFEHDRRGIRQEPADPGRAAEVGRNPGSLETGRFQHEPIEIEAGLEWQPRGQFERGAEAPGARRRRFEGECEAAAFERERTDGGPRAGGAEDSGQSDPVAF